MAISDEMHTKLINFGTWGLGDNIIRKVVQVSPNLYNLPNNVVPHYLFFSTCNTCVLSNSRQ